MAEDPFVLVARNVLSFTEVQQTATSCHQEWVAFLPSCDPQALRNTLEVLTDLGAPFPHLALDKKVFQGKSTAERLRLVLEATNAVTAPWVFSLLEGVSRFDDTGTLLPMSLDAEELRTQEGFAELAHEHPRVCYNCVPLERILAPEYPLPIPANALVTKASVTEGSSPQVLEDPIVRNSLEALALLHDAEGALETLQSLQHEKRPLLYPALGKLVIQTKDPDTLAWAIDLLFPHGWIQHLRVMGMDAFDVVRVLERKEALKVDWLDLDVLDTEDLSQLIHVQEFLVSRVEHGRVRVLAPAVDVTDFVNVQPDDPNHPLLRDVSWGLRIPAVNVEATGSSARLWHLKEFTCPPCPGRWVDVEADTSTILSSLKGSDLEEGSLLLDQFLKARNLMLKDLPPWFDQWKAARPDIKTKELFGSHVVVMSRLENESDFAPDLSPFLDQEEEETAPGDETIPQRVARRLLSFYRRYPFRFDGNLSQMPLAVFLLTEELNGVDEICQLRDLLKEGGANPHLMHALTLVLDECLSDH